MSQAFEKPLETLAVVMDAKTSEAKTGPGHYRTAFFEAFPRDPSTFIRGEGESIEAAEGDCWNKYQRILACKGHEFDRRGRQAGYCFCKHCGLGGTFLEPLTRCVICDTPTNFVNDVDGNFYCEPHEGQMPPEKTPEWLHRLWESQRQKANASSQSAPPRNN